MTRSDPVEDPLPPPPERARPYPPSEWARLEVELLEDAPTDSAALTPDPEATSEHPSDPALLE